MKTAEFDYIINTVSRTNILPTLSSCNTACIFCSHRQNPEGIEVFRMPELTLEDYGEIIEYLSPYKKIVIGESATRIIEGEPLLYKNFEELLRIIREKFPKTIIQITTNGILLSKELIDFMVQLGGVELNLSVNCVNPAKRAQILGLKKPNDIVEILKALESKLKFSGSCVFVPEVLTEKDIEDFVALMDACGAASAGIYLEGYTRRNPRQMGLREMYEQVSCMVESLRDKYKVPITIEPSFVENLECLVEGVVKGSPAFEASIMRGDIIIEVNSRKMLTRVEAFNNTYALRNPAVKLIRDDKELELKLRKEAKASPGFIMMYDIDPSEADEIHAAILENGATDVLIMTSELAKVTISKLMGIIQPSCRYNVVSVKNIFFGGNIKCAGLLTIGDIESEFHEYLKTGNRPDLVLIPGAMFDFKGTDLTGRKLSELEAKFGVAFTAC